MRFSGFEIRGDDDILCCRKIDAVRTLMRPGLLVAGGSDSFVTPLGPSIGAYAAVNHSNPMERVSVHQALQFYTINAVWIGYQEGDRGSLEVGELGDFAVLGEDPYQIDPRRIKDIKVENYCRRRQQLVS